jgi:nucleoid DNA-binding protein
MSLTKMDLVDSIYNQIDLPKRSCARLIDSLLESSKGRLKMARMF